MLMIAWNVRGFNDPLKQKEVKHFFKHHKCQLCALFETIVRRNNVDKVRKKLGSEWSWEDNNDYSPKGIIWIGWKPGSLKVQMVSKSEQVIVVNVETLDGDTLIWVADVYGLHTIQDRKALWQELLQISEESDKPLMLIGDFNAISKAADRLNGAPVTEAETQDLSNFVMESQLMEAPSTGLFYSWSNKSSGDDRVDSRIDRAYVNEAWNMRFPDVSVQYLPSGISDHSPLLVDLGNHDKGGGRPFKFQNILADHKDFMESVQIAWQSIERNHKMQSLWVKLKAVKQAVKKLHQTNYSHASLKIEENRQRLAEIQSMPDIHMNTEAQAEERHCYKQLKHWLKVDNSIWHQKSRITWISQSDTNSKLFFTYAKVRRARNNITLIQSENGDMLHTPDDIQGELV
ncbi:uncharacterized protein LOC125495557 [Beta vulgaris subsp. vulgaris]|uniref:uncharacterized protein LOC125495557 n=1 Tax=Beta vulgaris subsp. vulgaris TaxID=3555 RepID=UPI002036F306|nr:uncharacterized protein LOC125495557 [Beta vulgaris subsp. vulgaris]